LSDYRGPREGGLVTPQTIFRASYPGRDAWPLISQFLLKDMQYGSQPIVQQQDVHAGHRLPDDLHRLAERAERSRGWRPCLRPVHRYIRSLRDIAAGSTPIHRHRRESTR
jgi:hypothetical protein